MTHFQAATTIDLRDRRVSLHPLVVQNALLLNKGPAGDAAGSNSTWLCNKTMRVVGAAGITGRHLSPLVNMGGGGGEQVMLVAGREKVHFHQGFPSVQSISGYMRSRSTEQGPQAGVKELSAKHASAEALSMKASREFSRTPRRLSPCSDVSVLQKTRMSHFWDTHHTWDGPLVSILLAWPPLYCTPLSLLHGGAPTHPPTTPPRRPHVTDTLVAPARRGADAPAPATATPPTLVTASWTLGRCGCGGRPPRHPPLS